MAWFGHKNHVRVCQARNGFEKRIGNGWKVDGWVGDNTALEFNGCLVHGHTCIHDRSKKFMGSELTCDEAYARTQMKAEYIKSKNIKLITMWECEWRFLRDCSSEIKSFLKTINFDSEMVLNARDSLFGGEALYIFIL